MLKVKISLILAVGMTALTPLLNVRAQERAAAPEANDATRTEQAALRLIKSAEDMINGGEAERGLRTLDSVLERFPDSEARFRAHLVLGRYYVENGKFPEALTHLRNVLVLDNPDRKITPDQQEWVREALYQSGRTYFETRQYSTAFPLLRKLTRDHPNSAWSNQAHYYIGMCHFAQGNWQKAIDSLGLVGTFANADSPTASNVEIGRRFYVKIKDQDLPVAARLGKTMNVVVKTRAGDEEKIECVPLSQSGDLFIGSIPTRAGLPVKGDSILNLTSGDEVTVEYVDENTPDGKANQVRLAKVAAVSSGTLRFALSTFEGPARAAFLNQPLFLELEDADLDISGNPETVELRVISRYRLPVDENLTVEEQRKAPAQYETRNEVKVTLTEVGNPPVRTGKFQGRLFLASEEAPAPSPEGLPVLKAAANDEIVAYYSDVKHAAGTEPLEIKAMLPARGSMDGKPQATQYIVTDPIMKAKKNLVEAMAYLELGRIFQSMGLTEGAEEKCDEGLGLVNEIIQEKADMPSKYQQEAFQLKWELQMTKKDYAGAVATCQMFSRLYPESPIVDQALLGIGKVKVEEGEYGMAIDVYNRILAIPNSQVKAEAQFLIAQAVEESNKKSPRPKKDAAIPHYKMVADRYPDSEFAGTAIAVLVDYYIETKDYSQAEDLLRQVFEDQPDAKFLDAMLLKWVVLAYRKQDFQVAKDKASQLLFDYPESRFAPRVQEMMPRIDAKLTPSNP